MDDVCEITSPFHVLIETNNLQQTMKFYKGVLGLREAPRQDFGVAGAWLACSSPIGEQIWAEGPGMGPAGGSPHGTTTIDHVSLTAIGHKAFCQRFKKRGPDWREYITPKTTLWQLPFYDPSGVQLELTFDEENEGGPHGPVMPGHESKTGGNFSTGRSIRSPDLASCGDRI